MTVEFFSAECKLCTRTLNMLTHRFPQVPIIVHKASECRDGSCCALSEQYGVRAVPSLVVDGRVVLTGMPTEDDWPRLEQILGKRGE